MVSFSKYFVTGKTFECGHIVPRLDTTYDFGIVAPSMKLPYVLTAIYIICRGTYYFPVALLLSLLGYGKDSGFTDFFLGSSAYSMQFAHHRLEGLSNGDADRG